MPIVLFVIGRPQLRKHQKLTHVITVATVTKISTEEGNHRTPKIHKNNSTLSDKHVNGLQWVSKLR
jgi:hypothetical protein